MAEINQIIKYFDLVLSKTLSEPWDNDGVMVVTDEKKEIKKVLIALDVTSESIKKATELKAELIISHHPLVFKPLARIEPDDPNGKRVLSCIKNNISVLSYHTRLDEAEGGVNDCLATKAGLLNITKMQPCGSIGYLHEETEFTVFAEHIRKVLGLKSITGVNAGNKVKKVAVLGGSGKDFIADAKKNGCDTFLTGEVNHSGLIEAKEMGINIVCGTHYATENVVLDRIKELLLKEFPYIEAITMPFDSETEYGI